MDEMNDDQAGLLANAGAMALTNAGPMMQRLGGPKQLLGKIVGLGADEVEAGIPWWAWGLIGIGVGAVGAYFLHDQIERVVGSDDDDDGGEEPADESDAFTRPEM
jgi:hypothetical protein